MTILLADPRVSAVPVEECGEPLMELPARLGEGVWVRRGLAERLTRADATLPPGMRLRVVEGHRSVADQSRILASYTAELARRHPGASAAELATLASRFVAPVAVAPHVAGAAVDLTLVDGAGTPYDLGTPVDATPEESDGACYFAARTIAPMARFLRHLLAEALTGAGLVNYPTEWWHWSFGDRYWALTTGATHALYGPVACEAAA
ncbi:MAG: M15 family metallopeptidase [Nocardioidaceae bacterium]